MTISRRVLLPTLAWFAVLFFGVLSYTLINDRLTSQAQEEQSLTRLAQIFQNRLITLKEFSLALATETANNPEVQAAFAAGDRQRLIDLTLPGYLQLDAQFDVPQFQFHLPPAMSFLRLHQLENFGDDLSSFRFTVLAANAEQRAVAGVEIGRGGLGMRGVVPVSYQDEHIGSVEFGLNIDLTLLQELKEQYGVEWQLLLSREPAETATFQGAVGGAAGPTPELLLQATTLETAFYAQPEEYNRALAGETTISQVNQAGRSYATLRSPLVDFSGQIIGLVEIISDRTTIVAVQNNRLVVGVIAGLAALTLGGIGLAWIITRNLRPVRTLTETATAITQGNFSQLAVVKTKDELGQLAEAFNSMTTRLRQTLEGLEQQVTQRTLDLELRSAYLHASSEVSRAIATILDPDQLMQSVVDMVRERFSLYYVGLFVTDENGEWAVLKSGTGEAGRAMLARGHRIRVGAGMVGWAIANATPRIALEAGEDAIRLASPELPDTRSEAALPLRTRDRITGAMTIQSAFPEAFNKDNIAIFQILADQVAIALDNARLFTQSHDALNTLQRVYGEISQQAWKGISRSQTGLAYRSDEHGLSEADDIWYPEMNTAVVTGQTVIEENQASNAQNPIAIPIKVRGSVIGVLDTRKPQPGQNWSSEEISLLEQVTEQLGVALESARLYSDTQRSAERERLIAEITSRIRQTLDVDTVLKSAVLEMRHAFDLAEVEIRLGQTPGQDHPNL